MQDFTVFGEREREGWTDGRIVDAYLKHFRPITDEIGEAIAAAAVTPGAAVLDLCCGQGSLTAKLTAMGAETTGLDFSPEMLALAARAAPEAELVEGDAMAMPFSDGRFDLVLCNFGMMHIPDQPKTLREVKRVLKPGGRFVMATWMAPQASPAFGAVFGALRALADFSAAPPQPDLFAFANAELAAEMMDDAGLRMTKHDVATSAWVMDRPEELFEIFLTATVGAGMLIRSQAPDVIAAIGDRIAATVRENFADGDGYRAPVPVAVITAEA